MPEKQKPKQMLNLSFGPVTVEDKGNGTIVLRDCVGNEISATFPADDWSTLPVIKASRDRFGDEIATQVVNLAQGGPGVSAIREKLAANADGFPVSMFEALADQARVQAAGRNEGERARKHPAAGADEGTQPFDLGFVTTEAARIILGSDKPMTGSEIASAIERGIRIPPEAMETTKSGNCPRFRQAVYSRISQWRKSGYVKGRGAVSVTRKGKSVLKEKAAGK